MYLATMSLRRPAFLFMATLVTGGIWQSAAFGVDGTWTSAGGGNFTDSGNWSGGTVASGVGATANFNTVNIDGDVSVTLNANHTLGHMIWGDTNLGSPGTWEVRTDNDPVPTLTLDAGGPTPTITVNQLAPTAMFDDVFIAHRLNGTAGLSKNGVGILSLSGAGGTLAGPINVNAGTLRLVAPYTNTGTTTYNLANGTTLQSNVSIPSATVAAGGAATISMTATGSASNVTPAGTDSSINVGIGTATTTATLDMAAAWQNADGTTRFSNATFTGLNPGAVSFIRIQSNPTSGSGLTGYNAASLSTTAVTLNNVNVRVRTNSFGNTIQFGSLSGDATAQLAGGNAGPGTSGSAARYEIGGLNTSTVFSGQINGTGGISLNKIGSGMLTLAGAFQGDATNNSLAVNDADPDRQGGMIRVTGGTLKLTGATSIPGGFGARLTTIDVLNGATFDVSGTPGTFSTSTLQKLQGSGTIVGTYNHDEGFIRPGDLATPSSAANEGNMSAAVTPTAGTINFNGALQLNGGTIIYDMAPTPGPGNDLVNVTGTVALNSGVISPNFLNGIPTSGTYTVITASGGFTGSASNIIVNFPGRGTDPVPTISGNSLVFNPSTVGAAADVIWRGNHGTNPTYWDVETTQNWLNGASPDVFFNLDSVTFDDTAVGTAVDVRTIVQPNSTTLKPVAINISGTKNFTFTGNGSIIGPGGLTKTGTGMLTMQVNNAFTGASSIEGTVDIGGFSTALGTGQLTLNNATVIGTASLASSGVVVPAGTQSTFQVAGNAGAANFFNIASLSGDGELTLTSTVDDKAFGLGVTNNFTGTLNVQPSSPATLLNAVRVRGGQTTLPGAVVNITGARISNQQGAATGSTVNIEFGEIHGDSTTQLNAFEGGSADRPNANWQIGALNTDSNFDGTIVDGATPAISMLTKVGTGTLTLAGANTYSGTTTVNGGTLRVNGTHQRSETTMLAVGDYTVNSGGTLGGTGTIGSSVDPVDVILNGGAINPGASVGTLTVNGNVDFGENGIFDIEIDANAGTSDLLVVNGNLDLTGLNDKLQLSLVAGSLPEAGPLTIATYSGTLTGTFNLDNANFTINYGTGSNSSITISNITAIEVGVPGDYNNDGTVDAGDYVRWRNNLGDPTEADINNNGDGGGVTISDYSYWKARYGNPGSGGGGLSNTSVPEPASVVLILMSIVVGARFRRRG